MASPCQHPSSLRALDALRKRWFATNAASVNAEEPGSAPGSSLTRWRVLVFRWQRFPFPGLGEDRIKWTAFLGTGSIHSTLLFPSLIRLQTAGAGNLNQGAPLFSEMLTFPRIAFLY